MLSAIITLRLLNTGIIRHVMIFHLSAIITLRLLNTGIIRHVMIFHSQLGYHIKLHRTNLALLNLAGDSSPRCCVSLRQRAQLTVERTKSEQQVGGLGKETSDVWDLKLSKGDDNVNVSVFCSIRLSLTISLVTSLPA